MRKPPDRATGTIAPARLPRFKLPTADGAIVTAADFTNRRLVLFCYPRAGTEGCTQEVRDFDDLSARFAAADCAVVGLSPDAPGVLAKFATKLSLTIPLLSDPDHVLLDALGAWGTKSMYGRNFDGVLRTTFWFDAFGRTEHVWPRVRVKGHAEAVLAAVTSAQS